MFVFCHKDDFLGVCLVHLLCPYSHSQSSSYSANINKYTPPQLKYKQTASIKFTPLSIKIISQTIIPRAGPTLTLVDSLGVNSLGVDTFPGRALLPTACRVWLPCPGFMYLKAMHPFCCVSSPGPQRGSTFLLKGQPTLLQLQPHTAVLVCCVLLKSHNTLLQSPLFSIHCAWVTGLWFPVTASNNIRAFVLGLAYLLVKGMGTSTFNRKVTRCLCCWDRFICHLVRANLVKW